ncbi:hypothetical protein KVT40_007748 [Elsinoe batatas]|uniref:RRM domain-containing protein n=1 Tax=Elsinoe batatas TaxID=2601811 RepID=A0A8K0KZ58_9PEZI|nr:hypothetical protein KVT40_007748 [Elsinoe batatas]
MADADDFDIDIYGDDRPEELVPEPADQPPVESREDTAATGVRDYNDHDEAPVEPETEPGLDGAADDAMIRDAEYHESHDKKQTITPTAGQVGLATADDDYQEESSHREADPDALPALKLIEVQWWTTEDDIRGWANAAHAEDELIEITFNEHKVNGKSKGEVFVEFQTPEAATAMKHEIDSVVNQAPGKKINVLYAHSSPNPYKSLPKDAQNRNKDGYKDKPHGNYNGGYNNQNNFRGGRGGYNRGGYQNRGGYNQNNNQMGMMNGFGGMGMGMGSMGGFGGQMGFNRGGGMMGMNRGGFQNSRGGRGGMMGGMMPNMGMGGMGGMGMDMGMGMGYGGGFQQGGYNNNQSGGNSPPSNPHGAKRPRAE